MILFNFVLVKSVLYNIMCLKWKNNWTINLELKFLNQAKEANVVRFIRTKKK